MLTDLLVALAVVGFVMASNLLLVDQGQRAYQVGAARVEAQQTARIALIRIANDIRTAGSSLAHPAFPAVSVAEPSRLVLHRDWDGDGVIAGTRDTVTWFLDGTTLRRNAGGGAQPIIDGARALAFAYFDAAGAPATAPEDVRSVRVTLTTGAAARTTGAAARTTVTTHIRLRNR
jgi:hypothetical protein